VKAIFCFPIAKSDRGVSAFVPDMKLTVNAVKKITLAQ
jgi:hypothetical protein